MASSELDLLDPDEYFAEHDRRAAERLERRAARTDARRERARRKLPAGHPERPPGGEHRSEELGARPERKRASGRLGAELDFTSAPGGRALVGVALALLLATIAGLGVLWPTGTPRGASHAFGHTTRATVTRAFTAPCGGPSRIPCRDLEIEVGRRRSTLSLGLVTTAPSISAGTPIRVSPVPLARGQTAPPGYEPWQFVDIDRHGSLLELAVILILIALVVIRWRGLLAALGAGLSILLLVEFLVPAILSGEPALPVALTAALAVMFVTIACTHGVGPQSLAAVLGIAGALLLTCLLAVLAIGAAHLDGRTDELSAYLEAVNPRVSLQGIVLAGMVVGALGVLADTAVTQSSAVMALRRANPQLVPRQLYRSAFHVGRDHLSATIHTLVLAYAGASLPLLLVTRSTGVGLVDALSSQDIAEPVVATLVGCIALVCAVPVTTGLATLLMSRIPADALADGHVHHH